MNSSEQRTKSKVLMVPSSEQVASFSSVGERLLHKNHISQHSSHMTITWLALSLHTLLVLSDHTKITWESHGLHFKYISSTNLIITLQSHDLTSIPWLGQSVLGKCGHCWSWTASTSRTHCRPSSPSTAHYGSISCCAQDSRDPK